MPEYLAPAVFVEETSFRSKSIEGVGTSTAAFVGLTSRGPVTALKGNAPPLLTSFSDFERIYGGFEDLVFTDGKKTNYLAHAVRSFFDNGGGRLYVARVVDERAKASSVVANKEVNEAAKKVTFVARAQGGAEIPGTDKFNFRVNVSLIETPSTLKLARAQPFGTLVKYPSTAASGEFAAHFLDGKDKPVSEDKSPLPTDPSAAVGILTMTAVIEDASGGIVEYSDLGLHPKHPRAANVVLGKLPPKAADALVNPVMLQLGDGAATPPDEMAWGGLFKAAFDRLSKDSGDTALAAAKSDSATAAAEVAPASAASLAAKATSDAKEAAAVAAEKIVTDAVAAAAAGTGPAPTQAQKEAATTARNAATQAAEAATAATADETKKKNAAQIAAAKQAEFEQRNVASKTGQPIVLTAVYELKNGSDGDERKLAPPITAYQEALDKLGALEDISIIAAPGGSSFEQAAAINDALVTAAQKARAYRIAVLDTPPDLEIAGVREIKSKIDSKYAAIYYPWVVTANPMTAVDPTAASEIALPPSGFVCGIYARSDIQRGVWKAPANETISGALRLERDVSFGEQEVLNPLGVNCLRFLPNRGYRVWGARTTSSDPEWKYVNIRRFFLYLESSIDRGSQWAVFEPNGERLWANVRETISDFLYNEWINGALLGNTPKEAFFVRCDRTTMTQNDLDNGRLICLIGVAAIKPAEFVIFRIGQKTADARS
jgi:uncharacterized protein